MKHEFNGIVEAVLVGKDINYLPSERVDQVVVTFAGFEGDRHAGITMKANPHTGQYPRGTEIRNYRQVSIISSEEMAFVAEQLSISVIQPEWLAANLLISGIPNLTHLPPGTRLCCTGGVTLLIQAFNAPCINPGKIIQSHYPQRPGLAEGFVQAARQHRGLVGVVEKHGILRAGEQVIAYLPALFED